MSSVGVREGVRIIGSLWLAVAIAAGLMGALLISDEPGVTAGRWYLAIAVLAGALGLACFAWRHPRALPGVAIASVLLAAVIGVHAFVVVAFAYQGLTLVLLVRG